MLFSCLLFNDQNSIKKINQNNIASYEYQYLDVKIILSIGLYFIVIFRRQEAGVWLPCPNALYCILIVFTYKEKNCKLRTVQYSKNCITFSCA